MKPSHEALKNMKLTSEVFSYILTVIFSYNKGPTLTALSATNGRLLYCSNSKILKTIKTSR